MGHLHKGHLDLMRMGKPMADHLVISIFVNPTQFGPSEDLDKYPRDLPRDTELAASVGVECIFHPSAEAMYPKGSCTYVEVENISEGLCGASRPGHFRGVATVVTKLFNISEPDIAIFGEKDYQQLAVLRKMAEDLNMNVRVLAHPTVREDDGLAMSSRNKYLSAEQRQYALVLSQALLKARRLVEQGERSAEGHQGRGGEDDRTDPREHGRLRGDRGPCAAQARGADRGPRGHGARSQGGCHPAHR